MKVGEVELKFLGHSGFLISHGKKNDLAARRAIAAILSLAAAKKVYKEIAPRFLERRGGYTRITKLGQRLTDGAKTVFIEILK